uniref:Chromo domain-containing protein n=1 Tax=Caenorhabditis japonica TaxID=281687 RepID=A0A8R1HUJ6_CAEJA
MPNFKFRARLPPCLDDKSAFAMTKTNAAPTRVSTREGKQTSVFQVVHSTGTKHSNRRKQRSTESTKSKSKKASPIKKILGHSLYNKFYVEYEVKFEDGTKGKVTEFDFKKNPKLLTAYKFKVTNQEDDVNQEYSVEKIIAHRFSNGKPLFLVQWKNFENPVSHTEMWEDELSNCKAILSAYKESENYTDSLKSAKKSKSAKASSKSKASSSKKSRGRPSKSAVSDGEGGEQTLKKKKSKVTSKKAKHAASESPDEEEEEEESSVSKKTPKKSKRAASDSSDDGEAVAKKKSKREDSESNESEEGDEDDVDAKKDEREEEAEDSESGEEEDQSNKKSSRR